MIICTKCGLHNADNDAFCGSCGAFLEWDGEKVVEGAAPAAAPAFVPPPPASDPSHPGFISRAKSAVVSHAPHSPGAFPPPPAPLAAPSMSVSTEVAERAQADAAEAQRQAEDAQREREAADRELALRGQAEAAARAAADAAAQAAADQAAAAQTAAAASQVATANAAQEGAARVQAEQAAAQSQAAAQEATAEVQARAQAEAAARARQRSAQTARQTATMVALSAESVEVRQAAEADAAKHAEAETEAAQAIAAETEARTRAEEQARQSAQSNQAAVADVQAHVDAEAQAQAQAAHHSEQAAQAQARAQQEAQARAEAEAVARQQLEAKAKAEAEAKQKADVEAAAKAAFEERQRRAELLFAAAAPPAALAQPVAPAAPAAAPVANPAAAAPAPAGTPAPPGMTPAPTPTPADAVAPDAVAPGAMHRHAHAAPHAAAAPQQVIHAGDLICGQCGTGNEPQRRFCRRCGASLVEAVVQAKPAWWKRFFQKDPAAKAAKRRDHAHGPSGKKKAWRETGKLVRYGAMGLGVAAIVGGVAFPDLRAPVFREIGYVRTDIRHWQHPPQQQLFDTSSGSDTTVFAVGAGPHGEDLPPNPTQVPPGKTAPLDDSDPAHPATFLSDHSDNYWESKPGLPLVPVRLIYQLPVDSSGVQIFKMHIAQGPNTDAGVDDKGAKKAPDPAVVALATHTPLIRKMTITWVGGSETIAQKGVDGKPNVYKQTEVDLDAHFPADTLLHTFNLKSPLGVRKIIVTIDELENRPERNGQQLIIRELGFLGDNAGHTRKKTTQTGLIPGDPGVQDQDVIPGTTTTVKPAPIGG